MVIANLGRRLKIQYLSDLHLEKQSINIINTCLKSLNCDVLVLAGDIGHPACSKYQYFLQRINETNIHTYVVSGNHEYYMDCKHDISSNYLSSIHSQRCNKDTQPPNTTTQPSPVDHINRQIQSLIDPFQYVHFLNNNYHIIERDNHPDLLLHGSTLWSHVVDNGSYTNDIDCIQYMDMNTWNRLHEEAVNSIEQSLCKARTDGCKVIMITHYPPLEFIPPIYIDSPVNQWFYNNLNAICQHYNDVIQFWVYGHTHIPKTSKKYGIQFTSNPIQNILNEPTFNRFIYVSH